MSRIISFEDFSKKASKLAEEDLIMQAPQGEFPPVANKNKEEQYYMFFQNLETIKHHIEEILSYDSEKIDSLLQGGHDWAADHIATSKDDVQEVAEWLRNEMSDMEDMGSDDEDDEDDDEEESDDDSEEDDEEETEDEESEDDEEESDDEESEEDEEETDDEESEDDEEEEEEIAESDEDLEEFDSSLADEILSDENGREG
jgi:hypothetical protein